MSIADGLSKEMDCSATELQPSSSSAREEAPMLPRVVHLNGRIDSSVIPFLAQSLAPSVQAPYVILDLLEVDAIETSVAEYIQSEAEKKRVAPLSIVVSCSQLAVTNDLGRGKVNYSHQLAASPVRGAPNAVGKMQVRAYETLDDAICVARYGHTLSFCVLNANMDAAFAELNEVISNPLTSGKLEFILPELHLEGVRVRELKRGDTIACAKYPFQPSYIILKGRVDVRQPSAAPVDDESRICIRKTILAAARAIFQRQTGKKEDPAVTIGGPRYIDGPKVVAPQPSCCARVASESCQILDMDPARYQRWCEIVERARQSGDTKEMKYCSGAPDEPHATFRPHSRIRL
jgi:anti-anti-sigma regulatory factor